VKEDLEELRHIDDEEVQAIRHFKLKELQKAWDDLFAIGIVPVLYGRHPEYTDYRTFEESFREKSKITWGSIPDVLEKINPEIEKMNIGEKITIGIKVKGIEENEVDLFLDEMLSFDYNPPHDWNVISEHLLILVGYYSNANMFMPSIEMRADLALCKLIGAANRLYGAVKARGETILTGRKKQEEIVASGQADVFAAFQYLGIKNKPRYRSKRHIAKNIRMYLISENKELPLEKQKKIPSERTIIRYMESDEKIRNDLIEMGVMKDKPTLVQ
jgi:hypothetical protein